MASEDDRKSGKSGGLKATENVSMRRVLLTGSELLKGQLVEYRVQQCRGHHNDRDKISFTGLVWPKD